MILNNFKTLIVLLLMLGGTNLFSQSAKKTNPYIKMNEQYYLKDTVNLSGEIRSSRYLSRMENSDIEYFNDAYLLYLNDTIKISNTKNTNEVYEEISSIEIINPYECDIFEYEGKQVKIKGVLDVFTPHAGYYRQYSTPVFIKVSSVEVVD